MTNKDQFKSIFEMNSIAVVGMSPNPNRPSNYVAHYLKKNGFKIYPVNPAYQNLNNMKCYSSLVEISNRIDIVDIFRNPKFVVPIVKDAIKINAKVVWFQDGVINDEAINIAKNHNLKVIINDCMLRKHKQTYNN